MHSGRVVLGLMAIGVFAIVFDAVQRTPWILMDEGLFREINILSSSESLGFLAGIITQFGSEIVLGLVTLILYFWRPRMRRMILGLILTVVLSDLVLLILKSVYFRPRPYEVLDNVVLPIGKEGGSSFPSGHTTRAAAFTGIIGIEMKAKVYGLFLILAIAVALSRVLLGVHFPLDVVGGFSLGIALAVASAAILDVVSHLLSHASNLRQRLHALLPDR